VVQGAVSLMRPSGLIETSIVAGRRRLRQLRPLRQNATSLTDKRWRERPSGSRAGPVTPAPGRVAHAIVCAVSPIAFSIAGGKLRRPVPSSR
jgi:hypothetical protein